MRCALNCHFSLEAVVTFDLLSRASYTKFQIKEHEYNEKLVTDELIYKMQQNTNNSKLHLSPKQYL